MVIEDEVLQREIIRSEDVEKTRICDLDLRRDGHIYLVDVEQTRKGKRKYAVCMNYLLSAQEEKLNKEVFSELPGPRGIIVSSLCGSTNQRFAVICKGDFPFPFQTSDQNIELEVKSRMQAIDFYCKKCRKSMRISYALTGDRTAPAMNSIMIKCHTHKCTRVVTLKNFTEGQILERTDALGKCYL